MNMQAQRKANGGFTLVEVTLAVGIVAFGLVAIFSILPFGLTAQKDNQEDTIFRYEAEYWFAVLQAGGLPLDSLNRVETIELWKDDTPYRINRFDLSVDQASSWPADVCGWLSAPADKVDRKYAYVRAINGSLYDRLSGYRHRPDSSEPPEYYLPGGEFAFGYILETRVEKRGNWGCEITLTFHWPISESAGDALNSGYSIGDIMDNKCALAPPFPETTPVKSKTFTTSTGLSPRPALMEANLDRQQLQFLHTGLPGDVVSITALKNGPLFETRDSANLWDGFTRHLSIDPVGLGTVFVDVSASGLGTKEWNALDGMPIQESLSEAFSGNDIGWHVKIGLETFRIAEVLFEHPVNGKPVNGHYIHLENPKGSTPFSPPSTPGMFLYAVEFLDPNSDYPTWEKLLNSYEQLGLVEGFIDPDTGEEERRFGSVYKSSALDIFGQLELKNPGNDSFSVNLETGDYSPNEAPDNPACSFWFLR